MTYEEEVINRMTSGSVVSDVWRARDSFVTRLAWPSVLQDREGKEKERKTCQTTTAKCRSTFVPKFRPPSAPNPRVRHSQPISGGPELEPVYEKSETEKQSSRPDSRLSRVSTPSKFRESEETLQNPQAVTDPLIFKSRLESSFKMFRMKTWRPYTASNNDVTRHTCRMRPQSSRYGTREAVLVKDVVQETLTIGGSNGGHDHQGFLSRRPRSVPPHLLKGSFNDGELGDKESDDQNIDEDEVEDDENDDEDDDVISRQLGIVEATSPILSTHALTLMTSDGDISCRSTNGTMRTKNENSNANNAESLSEKDSVDEKDDDQNSESKTNASVPTIYVSAEAQDNSESSESSSEEEADEEYEDSESLHSRKAPTLDLPPEHFETDYGALSDLPDPVRFDFDVTSSPEPPFTFSQPLPEQLQNVNFRKLVECGYNWRQVEGISERQFTEVERSLFDRLMDLERLQLQTEQIEHYRRDQLRRAYRDHQDTVRRLRSQGMSASRIASATRRNGGAGMGVTGSVTNRQCCSSCLQPACAGDCPLKTARPKVCVLCRQIYCDGSCAENSYSGHQRSPNRNGSRPLSSSSASTLYANSTPTKRLTLDRPKSCNSCRVPAQAFNHRLINANSIVLGRPDSQKATFTSGEHSRRPVDYRPPRDSPAAHGLQDNRGGYRKLTTMIKKFESLGMSPTAPPPRMQRSRSRAQGRNGIEPGKTRISCRRDSLTKSIVNVNTRSPSSSQVNSKCAK